MWWNRAITPAHGVTFCAQWKENRKWLNLTHCLMQYGLWGFCELHSNFEKCDHSKREWTASCRCGSFLTVFSGGGPSLVAKFETLLRNWYWSQVILSRSKESAECMFILRRGLLLLYWTIVWMAFLSSRDGFRFLNAMPGLPIDIYSTMFNRYEKNNSDTEDDAEKKRRGAWYGWWWARLLYMRVASDHHLKQSLCIFWARSYVSGWEKPNCKFCNKYYSTATIPCRPTHVKPPTTFTVWQILILLLFASIPWVAARNITRGEKKMKISCAWTLFWDSSDSTKQSALLCLHQKTWRDMGFGNRKSNKNWFD